MLNEIASPERINFDDGFHINTYNHLEMDTAFGVKYIYVVNTMVNYP